MAETRSIEFKRPPAIAPGATIAVVAPAGPFDADELARGLAAIEARGYRYLPVEDLGSRRRYLAADDARRAVALRSAFANSQAAAVWCVRGGYGSMRLLPELRVSELPHKALIGFSDVTALHAAWQASGRMSIHGPVITQFGHQPKAAMDRLFMLLEGRSPPALGGARTVRLGRARGPLLGGNLAVLSRLVGTRWFPDLRGAVLLLEEVAERPYRLDRMWTHLRLAGVLDGLAGVAIGRLDACEEPGADYTAAEVMADLLRELPVPSAMGFPIGHGGENQAVLLGGPAVLDADAGTLESA
jgi:muramoyltetrapeptide carboxypeptidase